MDTSGFSQVGRYGTISLMKRHEPNTVVTAFGVDSEELTFGRDPGCSVRLYYPEVSLVHCKIVFEDRKAFLVVLGEAGLFIDGCKVYPNNPAAGSSMTIPLTNNSELEIHYKRFRFSYPPKDLRATLMASPAPPRNRALRLSMIQSAQVFTPRPSKDPRENLRVLQSPLKNTFKSPSKPSSLSRTPLNAPEEEEEIVLVDGNHPLVVEEERDLVILEDVEVQPPAPPVPPQYQAPPQTPQRKRSLSRNTLHRAVLIRSAQRAVLRAEKEREEEEEEMEVLGAVAANVEESDEEAGQSEEEYTDEDEDEEESEQHTTAQKSLWRKSLERIWPFGSSSGAEEEVDDDGAKSNFGSDSETEDTPTNEIPQDDEHDDAEMEEEENLAPLPTVPVQTPARRVLGSFMTPQARGPTRTTFPHSSDKGQAPPPQLAPGGSVGRLSLGGIEAKRVPLPQTWRVRDIVVPINPAPPSTPQGVRKGTGFSLQQTTPRAAGFSGRQTLTEEERKAIQDRRRSALREADTFFVGGVPGMSSSKPTPASSSSGFAASNSASPMKLTSNLFAVRSPVKPGQAADRTESTGDDEDELDTRSLLERMKETVEGMKRRRSMAPGVGLDSTPRPGREFSTPREIPSTPLPALFAAAAGPISAEPEETEKGLVEDKELESVKDVPFSLLAPGAREELLTRRQSVVVLDHASTVPVVIDAASDDDMNVDEPSTEKTTTTKERPKARLLRSKKSAAEPEEAEVPIEEQESANLNLEPKTKARTGARRGATPRVPTPQPEPEVDVGEPDVHEPKLKVPTSRRTRTRTADPEETPVPPPVVAKRGSVRKATVEPEEAPAAPARRGRKAIAELEPEEVPEAKTVVRRGRKPAAAAVKEDEDEDAVVPAPTTVKRGTRKGATTPTADLTKGQPTSSKPATATKRGKKVSVDDEADPLAIEVPEDETPAPKAKGKKKVVAVKQEDELEDHADLPPPPSKKPVRKATAVKTPAAKPRAKKTPASAPATIEGEVDKENTPRSMSPATPELAEEGAVKVRVPRTRGTKATGAGSSKTKVKVEDTQEVDEPARGRSMRSRTRTKTG